MPTLRNYTNAAPTLNTQAVSSSATSVTLSSGTFTGWPVSFPFYAAFELGTSNTEIVSVTNIVGTTATIVRGQDGTTAIAHAAGVTFDHTGIALDLREANAHTSANAGVHGAAGNVVGTTDAQTLTNKTLTSPVMNTTAGTPVITSKAAAAADKVFSGRNSSNTETSWIKDDGSATLGALTAGAITGTSFTGQVLPKSYTNEAAAGTTAAGTLVYLTAPTTNGSIAGIYRSIGAGSYVPIGGSTATYSPVWSSTGTAPSLGNGSLTGRYTVIGKMLYLQVSFTPGSTTTFGTGTYSFSLPSGLTTATTLGGTCVATNSGVYSTNGLVFSGGGSTSFGVFLPSSTTTSNVVQTGATTPWTLKNGDTYYITATVEIQ